MIDAMATRMAKGIKRRAPDHPASVAVLKHSLAILINTVSIFVISLGIGAMTGRLKEAVIVLISFALLRMASGGIHLKSGTWCVIVTTGGVTLLSHISFAAEWIKWVTAAALVLVAMLAPTDIHKQSRIPRKYYPLLKMISVLVVSCNFLIASPTVAVSFLTQALTLIPRREVKNR